MTFNIVTIWGKNTGSQKELGLDQGPLQLIYRDGNPDQ